MVERQPFPGISHQGKVALVTGGDSGIGLETVLTLADLGADVVVLDWTPGAAEKAAALVEKAGRRALAFTGDAGDENAVVDAFAKTRDTLGPVDVAVACAGVLGRGGPVFDTSVADFEEVMGVNVRGGFLVVREAAKQMRSRKSGAIVLLSSLDGLQAEHGAGLGEGAPVGANPEHGEVARLRLRHSGDEQPAAFGELRGGDLVGRSGRPRDHVGDAVTQPEQIALTVFEVPLDRGLGGYQRFWLPSAMAKGGSARRVYLPESLVGDAIADESSSPIKITCSITSCFRPSRSYELSFARAWPL